MELTIQLPNDVANKLRREAERLGVEPQRYAVQIIQRHLPVDDRATSLHDLFAQWAAEDATDDPRELAHRQHEWEELKRA